MLESTVLLGLQVQQNFKLRDYFQILPKEHKYSLFPSLFYNPQFGLGGLYHELCVSLMQYCVEIWGSSPNGEMILKVQKK